MKKKNASIIAFVLISVLGMLFVLHTMSAQENLGNENDKYFTEGSGENVRFSPRQSVCSSGFNKIPSDLQHTYLNHVKAFKKNSQYLKYELKNKIDYYGFLYPKTGELVKNKDSLQCYSLSSYEKIKFIPPEINNLLKMYMSAYIENELIVQKLKREISNSSYTSTKIAMCMSYKCGAKNLNGIIKSHNIKTLDQLESVDEYTFTHLYINVLNDIKSKTQNKEYGFYLSDDEINSLIIDAGKVAISEVKRQKSNL